MYSDNLPEYDAEYLEALLSNNTDVIRRKEEAAMHDGYGPLVPCPRHVAGREKAQKCSKQVH